VAQQSDLRPAQFSRFTTLLFYQRSTSITSMILNQGNMIVKIILTGLVGILLLAFYIIQRQRSRDVATHQHDRSSVARLPIKEPFTGFDAQMAMYTDVPSMYRHHQRHGRTLEIRSWLAPSSFTTTDPANIRAVNLGKDWGVESMRLPGMEDFTGRGFLSTDGTMWQRSRKLLKPTFAKNNLQDLRYLSQQVDNMFSELPDDGTTVDLQPLFFTVVRQSCSFYSACLLSRHSFSIRR
jgi:hypothetical protein